MHKLKAVLDTNIMVSVAFPRGELTKELRDFIADEVFTLVTSKETIKELYRNFHYPSYSKKI